MDGEVFRLVSQAEWGGRRNGGQLSTSIWLEGGGTWWPFSFYFWTDVIQEHFSDKCEHYFRDTQKLTFIFNQSINFPNQLIQHVCMCTPGSYQLVSCSIHISLPSTCLPSQSGMKTGWHLTKGINHPWPKTNYPSLPTLWPLSGESHVTIAQHESLWHHRVLMDTPARPRLLRSPGRLTFKSSLLSNSIRTKEAFVQDHGLWPHEMKCRRPLAMRGEPWWNWRKVWKSRKVSGSCNLLITTTTKKIQFACSK